MFSIGERLDDEALEIAERAAMRGCFTPEEHKRLHYMRGLAFIAIGRRYLNQRKIETGRRLARSSR